MSAALVESVRRVIALDDIPGEQNWTAADDARGCLDLPAILAALTEAEALRAQVAVAQGEAARFREACLIDCGDGIETCELCRRSNIDHSAEGRRFATVQHDEACPCAAPTDTAALRAFGEKCAKMGAAAALGSDVDDSDIVDEHADEFAAIVDRVLGGS